MYIMFLGFWLACCPYHHLLLPFFTFFCLIIRPIFRVTHNFNLCHFIPAQLTKQQRQRENPRVLKPTFLLCTGAVLSVQRSGIYSDKHLHDWIGKCDVEYSQPRRCYYSSPADEEPQAHPDTEWNYLVQFTGPPCTVSAALPLTTVSSLYGHISQLLKASRNTHVHVHVLLLSASRTAEIELQSC